MARRIGTTHSIPTMEKTSPTGAKRKPIPKNMDANETKAKVTATAIIQSAVVAFPLRRTSGETNRSCSNRRLPFDQDRFPITSRDSCCLLDRRVAAVLPWSLARFFARSVEAMSVSIERINAVIETARITFPTPTSIIIACSKIFHTFLRIRHAKNPRPYVPGHRARSRPRRV